MAKSNTTTSYKFDDDFIALLDTWAHVTGKDKGSLLESAFGEYSKMPQNSAIAKKVDTVTKILKI